MSTNFQTDAGLAYLFGAWRSANVWQAVPKSNSWRQTCGRASTSWRDSVQAFGLRCRLMLSPPHATYSVAVLLFCVFFTSLPLRYLQPSVAKVWQYSVCSAAPVFLCTRPRRSSSVGKVCKDCKRCPRVHPLLQLTGQYLLQLAVENPCSAKQTLRGQLSIWKGGRECRSRLCISALIERR